MDLIKQGKTRRGNFHGIIIVKITIVLVVVAGLIGGFIGIGLDAIDFLGTFPIVQGALLTLLIPFTVVTIAFGLYVKLVEQRSVETLGFVAKDRMKKYAVGFLIGVGMIAFQILVISMAGGFTFEFEFNNTVLFSLIVMLFAFIVQGGAEEFMTRGFLLQAVGRRHGRVWAIIVSTLIFVLLHGMNPNITEVGFTNLALFSVFACLYALREGDIIGICALHSAWNWFMGPVMGVYVSGIDMPGETLGKIAYTSENALLTGGNFGLEGGLLCTLVLVIGSVILIVQMVNDAKNAESDASEEAQSDVVTPTLEPEI